MSDTVLLKDDSQSGSVCDFHVVAVGASAGGLEALEVFFRSTPTDLGAAYVVVQHLSPDFKSHMEQLLARQTAMPIFRVENGMEMRPNSIYLIPPRKEMIVSKRRLLLTDRDPSKSLSHPIDLFFRSVANDLGRFAIGVVLSGTGSDGSRGVRDIHEAGGLVLCQDEQSARFDGMPMNAQETGVVDLVLPPESLATALEKYIRGSLSPETLAEQELPASQLVGIEKLFDELRKAYGIDFGNYKSTTVGRRIKRRMAIKQTEDFDRYIAQVSENPEELDRLYRDLLIGVTQFFRDPELFERLESEAIPELLERVDKDQPFRAWVAGCATGEEAYSLAMVLHERMSALGRPPLAKIFATDVHRGSLEFAAKGVYPESALAEMSAERRDRFFTKDREGWHVSPELRQMIVFAPHNLVQDAPFTQLDMVTCRNLLIYLQPAAQKKALSFFHFALKTGGVLTLGPSETTGDLADEFSVVDKRWKVYRKRRDIRLPADVRLDFASQSSRVPRAALAGVSNQTRGVNNQLLTIYDQLLDLKMPASYLIDDSGELRHTFGGAERFLRPSGGRTSTQLIDLIEEGLRTSVSAAIQHALRESSEVKYSGLRREDGPAGHEQLDLVVTPITDPKTLVTNLLVELRPTDSALSSRGEEDSPAVVGVDIDHLTREHVTSLETELRTTQENLQATVEELETANEELQATNEELVASNEELQSTNEELHSVNEELYTVNAEHQRKIDELTRATEDLDNLLSSIQVGVVFLDRDLRVRRYTPGIGDAFDLLPQDVGRRIDTFSSRLDYDGLLEDLNQVLEKGETIEREVTDSSGRHYLARTFEYQSPTSSAGGLLLTLVDIETLKTAERGLRESEERFRLLLDSAAEGVIGLDKDGACSYVNRSAARLLGCDSEADLLGNDLCRYVHKTNETGEVECDICESLVIGEATHNANAVFKRASGEEFIAEYWSHPIAHDSAPVGAVVTFFDVTERRISEDQLRMQSRIMQLSHDAIIVWELDGGVVFWNRGAESKYGYTSAEAVGRSTHDLLQTSHPNGWEDVRNAILEKGEWTGELLHKTKEGDELHVSSRHQLMRSHDQKQLVLEINRNITDSIRAQRELRSAREAAESANRAKSSFLANMSHELRTPLSAILGFADILMAELDDPVNQERVATIRSNGAFLLELLNDILDLSKIEAGKLSIQPEQVGLVDLLADITRLMRVRAEAKDLTLTFELRSAVPARIETDARRFRQVLVNLLGNAIKFTHTGGVTLAASVTDPGDENGQLIIEVIDTGVGIEPKALKTVFRPFEQAAARFEDSTSGTGLGLSISKLLARELGGALKVKSEVNVGSRFTLTLPLRAVENQWFHPSELAQIGSPHTASRESGDDHRLDHRRVLVADDRRDIRHVAEYFLVRAGAEVILAEDGVQAIERIEEWRSADRAIDLVLMDMQMPNMNGYDATKTLIDRGFDRPIIALTAAAMKGERERCLDAGCADYLTKPIEGSRLIEVCAASLAKSQHVGAQPSV